MRERQTTKDKMLGFHNLFRKKHIDMSKVTESRLLRCLSTADLTAIGIGSTLGAGIYVVAGQVAKEVAGPAVTLSFLIAAIASVLAGLCYAEFGARVPRTGSAYVYSYVTVGEIWAFVIGWNLILEYVIGTASVARAWSAYFDSLINNAISNFFRHYVPLQVPSLSTYPDFFALAITVFLTGVLAIGVKESSFLNNIFTVVNMLVVTYVIICGLFRVDLGNWQISTDKVPASTGGIDNGSGGFLPFGISGVMSGAATCFYAFIGFDVIATTGEEVKNPQRAIPLSIVLSLVACFFAYFGISAVLTLMVPYYDLDREAPLPKVFEAFGWDVAKYVITIGAVSGLSTSLLLAMFPMPRVIYAMASDGLLFRFLANVNDTSKTPVIATVVSGLLAGVLAMLFDLKELVDMMSIGTLLAYTLVAASVLILRYDASSVGRSTEDQHCQEQEHKTQPYWRLLFNPPYHDPTAISSSIVNYCVFAMGVTMAGLSAVIIYLEHYIVTYRWWAIAIAASVSAVLTLIIVIIWRQPQNLRYITFKAPGLPLVPAISIFINIFLMFKLSVHTWIRFGIWLCVGFVIYFGYGIHHSSEESHPGRHKRSSGNSKSESDLDNGTVEEHTSLIRSRAAVYGVYSG